MRKRHHITDLQLQKDSNTILPLHNMLLVVTPAKHQLLMDWQEEERPRSIEVGCLSHQTGSQVQAVQRCNQHITVGFKIQAGTTCMECHNQMASVVYKDICLQYGLKAPRSKWTTPPKVVENDKAMIWWDFSIQSGKRVMANHPDIDVVHKQQLTDRLIDLNSIHICICSTLLFLLKLKFILK